MVSSSSADGPGPAAADGGGGGSAGSGFSRTYVDETVDTLRALDLDAVERVAAGLAALRARGGRLFVLGVGGSAAHASHAVNDFRKISGIEAYAPTDNVSELTARTNDEGWDTSLSGWLEVSRISSQDAVLVFSVGGGDADRNISPNLVRALDLAVTVGAAVFGVVGRDGGHTARVGEAIVIPPLHGDRVTAHTEGLCAVVWHLLVSHPLLKAFATKWEATTEGSRP
jgi:D-sedoheptulose 7-phosphate isomerase